jgi:hypothetical protein
MTTLNTLIASFSLFGVPTPPPALPPPPVYVPICIPGHPKCGTLTPPPAPRTPGRRASSGAARK